MSGRQQQLTGPDRWQISYADLITLLLGFFILMYAVSSMEADKKKAVISALEQEFAGSGAKSEAAEQLPQHADFGSVALLAGSSFSMEAAGDWLYLDVASEAVFESGSDKLMLSSRRELDMLAKWLETTNGLIEIEGHTDNQPINTAAFPNNWALSSARAVAIVNYLTSQHDLTGSRFRAVGFGEFSPIADNATQEGRQQNRRVVVKVENKPLLFATSTGTKGKGLDAGQPTKLTDRQSQSDITNSDLPKAKAAKLKDLEHLKQRLNKKGIDTQPLPSGGIKFSEGN